MMREANLPKIEVLLDKVNLVFQAIKESEQPEPYDLRLLEKYLREAHLLASDLTDIPVRAEPMDTPKGVEKPSPSDAPVAKSSEPQSEKPESPKSEDDREAVQKTGKDAASHRITPIEEQNEQHEEEKTSEQKRSAFQFVSDDQEEKEPSTSENELPSEVTEEQNLSGNDETYDEIFRQLEEIKRNREQFNQTHLSSEAESKAMPTENEEAANDYDEEVEDDEQSLNEQFKQESSDLVEQLKEKRIHSLVQEIDLNDKFWLANELFDGNGTLFNQLLRELDGLSNFEDAEKLVEEKARDFDWGGKERAAQKFYKFLRRRY